MNQSEVVTENRVASTEIYWTKDYGMFHFLKGNRDLNQGKINRLMRSVQNGLDLFRYCPIMVNEKFYVIDGQHRFYVCKKLGLNIYYVIVPEMSLRQIAEMNSNASRWKDKDFLNCYMDTGIEHYTVLRDFCVKYDISLGIGIILLSEGKAATGGVNKDDFKDGLFKVDHLDEATKLMDLVVSMKPFCSKYSSRAFIKAMDILLSNSIYDHDKFLDKILQHKLQIEPKSNHKEYMAHMEDLFNYHNQKRIRIY